MKIREKIFKLSLNLWTYNFFISVTLRQENILCKPENFIVLNNIGLPVFRKLVGIMEREVYCL